MKDLLKTYAPLVALAIGAFAYWGFGQVSALKEQNELLLLALNNQCEAIVALAPQEEEVEE